MSEYRWPGRDDTTPGVSPRASVRRRVGVVFEPVAVRTDEVTALDLRPDRVAAVSLRNRPANDTALGLVRTVVKVQPGRRGHATARTAVAVAFVAVEAPAERLVPIQRSLGVRLHVAVVPALVGAEIDAVSGGRSTSGGSETREPVEGAVSGPAARLAAFQPSQCRRMVELEGGRSSASYRTFEGGSPGRSCAVRGVTRRARRDGPLSRRRARRRSVPASARPTGRATVAGDTARRGPFGARRGRSR